MISPSRYCILTITEFLIRHLECEVEAFTIRAKHWEGTLNRDSLNIQHTKTYLNLFLLSTLATQIYPTRPPKSWRIYSTMLPTNKTSQVNWYRRLPTKLVVPAATVLPALILITHAARSTSKVEE